METFAAVPDSQQDRRAVDDPRREDVDHVFHELTRSICPSCRKVIDAKILLRDNKVYMSKRCPECGPFMALVYADAKAYTSFAPLQQAWDDSAWLMGRNRARMPARLRPVPRSRATRVPRHHRGQQRLRHGLPAVLRGRRARDSA